MPEDDGEDRIVAFLRSLEPRGEHSSRLKPPVRFQPLDDDMTTSELHRDLGRLEGTVTAQGTQLNALHVKTDLQTNLLQDIKGHIERQKGALRVILLLASALGAIAGFVVNWLKH